MMNSYDNPCFEWTLIRYVEERCSHRKYAPLIWAESVYVTPYRNGYLVKIIGENYPQFGDVNEKDVQISTSITFMRQ